MSDRITLASGQTWTPPNDPASRRKILDYYLAVGGKPFVHWSSSTGGDIVSERSFKMWIRREGATLDG